MATHQAKPISIRRRGDDDESNQDHQPTKIQRLDSSDEMVSPTKIIDLNDDCLMRIFGHLDLESLFNVAVANEWLRPAAGEVYKRKFGARKVKVSGCNDYAIKAPALKLSFYWIKVRGLKACLQFLRCFGAAITDLTIDFGNSQSKRYQYLLQQMNNFCVGSLVHVSFWYMKNMAVKQAFQKVFSNVTTVQFYFGSLGQQWPVIVECFPNVESLTLQYVTMIGQKTDENLIQKPFEHLQNIRIDGHLNGNNSSKIVANLLEMAHQLETLQIYTSCDFGFPMNTLLNQTKYDRSITKLTIFHSMSIAISVNSDEVLQLISQHPALIELDLCNHRFNVDDAIAVVHGLNALKSFHFQMLRSDYTHLVQQLDAEWKATNYRRLDPHDIVELER